MNQKPYKVEAFWDREAKVWVAESEDIPGLVTEADTIESLTAKLRQMIPELLQLNHLITIDAQEAITFELISHRQELIQCAGSKEMPQDVSFEEVMERLYFLYKIERGLQQVETDNILSHQQAKQNLKKWHK